MAVKIHVLRKPGSPDATMLTIDVTRVPCVAEIIHIDGAKPEHYRVLQVAHTVTSSQAAAEVWTELLESMLGDIWKYLSARA